MGNVGRAPEMKFTAQGVPVATFRMATTEFWRDRDGQLQEHTEWHTIVAWRSLADIVQKILQRGSRVYLEGKLQTRIFEDQNGTRKYFTEVVAEELIVLDGRRDDDTGYDARDSGGFRPPSADPVEPPPSENDIPF